MELEFEHADGKFWDCKNIKGMWWDDASLAVTNSQRGVPDSNFGNEKNSTWNSNLGYPEPCSVVRVDILQMSLARQAYLESELMAAQNQLKSAAQTIEKLSREVGSLAVAYDSAVDAVKRARVVLECILSGRFQHELEMHIRNTRSEIEKHSISVPSQTTLERLASLAKGFSQRVLQRYITQALGCGLIEYDLLIYAKNSNK